MKENEILEEIHRLRGEHARECGYDIHKIFEEIRQNTEKLKSESWQVVHRAPRKAESTSVLREEPPEQPIQPC